MNRLLAICISIVACCCTADICRAGGGEPGGPAGGVLGRCCFYGIVADPILCEVTTQEKCYFNTAPISWTPGLTCDSPCEAPGDIFAGCGTLGPGPQSCILFHADSGQSFALENAGGAFNTRVWVRGVIDPASDLCFPVTVAALLDNTIAPCFEGCGTLVNGVECVLFQADSGGLYILSNLAGFQVGDHVFVRGGLNPNCASFCMQGNGCIDDNTIEPCGGDPVGACCANSAGTPPGCTVTTGAHCKEIGGTYLGDGTSCNGTGTDPCAPALGRCCFHGFNPNQLLCEVTTQADCLIRPGYVSWSAGLTCATPCTNEPTGACCSDIFGNPLGCAVTTAAQCAEINGTYLGDGTACVGGGINNCSSIDGRCCFFGFNPNELLCEVTTRNNCLNHPGFVSWTAGLTCATPCENVPTGACCVPMDIPGASYCVVWSESQCDSVGGIYFGNGTNCTSVVCPTLGRCCFIGIVFPPFLCDVTTEEECAAYIGSFWTAGLTCDTPCDEPRGACCFFNSPGTLNCFVTTEAECVEQGGEYQGDGTNCGPTGYCEPPVTGACCLITPIPEGVCIQVTAEECAAQGGNYHGDGTECPPNGTCMFEDGACCLDIDDGPLQYDTCIVTSALACDAQGGVFQGPFTHCIVVACCLPNGACQDADPRCCAASGGTPRNTPCSATACTVGPIGACCLNFFGPAGSNCIEVTEEECAAHGGIYLGDGTACPPAGTPCPPNPTGACCIPVPGSPVPICQVLTAAQCVAQGGDYLGDGTPCPPPGTVCDPGPGACCRDIDDGPLQYDNCVIVSAAQCTQMGGVFQGANTQCVVAACCLPGGYCQPADPRCCTASGGIPVNAPCGSFECPTNDTGACCLVPNVPGTTNCIEVTEERCEQIGGLYRGDGTDCLSADLCPPLGRCCFVGIVPHPILCDVNTQAECMAYAGFISWTPNLTCDSPCEPGGGDVFSGCGTLGPGPQGCVLFHADSGEVFALENVGPVIANRVWVRGIIEPNSFLCFPVIMPGLLNNTIGICFDRCGVLVQGVECVLFQADSGGLYVVQNLGGHVVGDRVRVQGSLNPQCVTICQQGNGCIEHNTIEPCPIDPPTGACCHGALGMPGQCFVTTAAICQQVSGQYQGDGTVCGPNLTCPNPLGRCCYLGINSGVLNCAMFTEIHCLSLPAPVSWDANLTCDTPCEIRPPTGACCNTPVANPLGCIVVTEARCEELGGNYAGDGTTCWPVNPCAGPLGRCCFLGFNPQFPLCEVTTLAQCYNYPAPISWTPGINCDVPCTLPCDPGDANGDGTVNGRDIEPFVRSLLGSPAAGDHPDCCNFGVPTLGEQVESFVTVLNNG